MILRHMLGDDKRGCFGVRESSYCSSVAEFQSNVTCIYAVARESDGIIAVVMQKNAAEMHHHLRWLLGIEDTCSCVRRTR